MSPHGSPPSQPAAAGDGGVVRSGLRPPRGVLPAAVGVGAATGAYGISFGAVAEAGGLSVWQAVATSALMFAGASQFAMVAVLGAGGGALGAAATATLLGTRNAFYGLRLSSVLGVRGPRRLLAAHLMIDETAAMAISHEDSRSARWAFWATGASVFVLWNTATALGALGADALGEPEALGLDAAAPAAFIALLAPRLRRRADLASALAAGALALALTLVLSGGLPILLVGLLTVSVGLALPVPRRSARAHADDVSFDDATGEWEQR